MSVLFIAEVGVNHDGNLDKALELINVAAKAGADVVKFQTFDAANLASDSAPKAAYQMETTPIKEKQIDMLRRLELPRDWHEKLIERCDKRGVQFLSTPFDIDSLDFLVSGLNLPIIKIPSGELTHGPLLLAAARSGRKIILSTGMSNIGEIREALGVIAFGTKYPDEDPSRQKIELIQKDKRAMQVLESKVTLLHCNTQYPTPAEDANLMALATMREAFKLPVGYSDHTEGIAVALAAVALGASVIEKHITLDKRAEGPDHAASLEPEELGELVRGVRTCSAALGDGKKNPRPSEMANMNIARKSLVALTTIRRGEVFNESNVGAKRPGCGRSPMDYWDLIGQEAERDYERDDLI